MPTRLKPSRTHCRPLITPCVALISSTTPVIAESRSTTVVLGSPANGWGGEAADGAQGDQSGRQQGTRPGLPRTGR